MKKLIPLTLIPLLTSCSLYYAYVTAPFDGNEYQLVNSVRTQSNIGAGKCGKPEVVGVVDQLYSTTLEFRNYSEYLPHNEETQRASKELVEMVKDFRDRYHGNEPVGTFYCTTKFAEIEKNAVNIQNIVGTKPR
mgnify:CR=1 FL=1